MCVCVRSVVPSAEQAKGLGGRRVKWARNEDNGTFHRPNNRKMDITLYQAFYQVPIKRHAPHKTSDISPGSSSAGVRRRRRHRKLPATMHIFHPSPRTDEKRSGKISGMETIPRAFRRVSCVHYQRAFTKSSERHRSEHTHTHTHKRQTRLPVRREKARKAFQPVGSIWICVFMRNVIALGFIICVWQ